VQPAPKPRTRVEDVYQRLKDDICLGRLVPGSRFNLGEYSKLQGVSLTVVREAATRLSSERLMQLSPQQGFRIWPLSVPDLLDLTRVRIDVERLALPESVSDGDLAWEASVVSAHHSLAGAVRSRPDPATPNYAWLEAHARFHCALAAACSSPLLRQLRQQLFDSAELYRHWSAAAEPRRDRRPIAREHQALLDAALAHDAEKALALSVEHIQRTTTLLVERNSPVTAGD